MPQYCMSNSKAVFLSAQIANSEARNLLGGFLGFFTIEVKDEKLFESC